MANTKRGSKPAPPPNHSDTLKTTATESSSSAIKSSSPNASNITTETESGANQERVIGERLNSDLDKSGQPVSNKNINNQQKTQDTSHSSNDGGKC